MGTLFFGRCADELSTGPPGSVFQGPSPLYHCTNTFFFFSFSLSSFGVHTSRTFFHSPFLQSISCAPRSDACFSAPICRQRHSLTTLYEQAGPLACHLTTATNGSTWKSSTKCPTDSPRWVTTSRPSALHQDRYELTNSRPKQYLVAFQDLQNNLGRVITLSTAPYTLFGVTTPVLDRDAIVGVEVTSQGSLVNALP